ERRLIAHSGGDTAERSGHFGAGLRETEDVVDEEQNVLAFDVTEIFRLREAGESNTHTGSGRLVHLAIDQRHLGLVAFGVDNAAFDHFVVKVVTLTRPLANASEHRVTAVAHGDVVDQLHDQNRLANAGAAEEADLTALGVRREEVNNLNTGHQNFRFRGLIREIRGRRVDGSGPFGLDRAALVNRLADDVHDTAEGFRTDRHADRIARIDHFLTANQTFGRIHGNRPDGVLAKMLRHFQHQPLAIVVAMQSVQDIGEFLFKLYVHDGAQHLGNLADILCHFHAPYRVT